MYEKFFGIDEPPFRLTPDPRYLYLSAKHREARRAGQAEAVLVDLKPLRRVAARTGVAVVEDKRPLRLFLDRRPRAGRTRLAGEQVNARFQAHQLHRRFAVHERQRVAAEVGVQPAS